MILINNDVLITNETELNSFFQFLDDECYNEESELARDIVVGYLLDVWDNIKKVEILVRKKISPEIFPLAMVDITETGDWTKTKVGALSKSKDIEVGEKDKVIFNGLVEHYFAGVKPLFDRFQEID